MFRAGAVDVCIALLCGLLGRFQSHLSAKCALQRRQKTRARGYSLQVLPELLRMPGFRQEVGEAPCLRAGGRLEMAHNVYLVENVVGKVLPPPPSRSHAHAFDANAQLMRSELASLSF